MPALNEAISQRRFKHVYFLIHSGVNLNSKTSDGRTGLHQLCELEPEDKALTLAKVFIEKGAKVDKTDCKGRSGLMCAILQEREKLIALFLGEMFNFNLNASDNDGNTALTHAALMDNLKTVHDIVRGLKKFGLSVDVKNNEGMTPLMVAAKHGHLSCAEVIHHEGKASKFIRDNMAWKTAAEWEHNSPILRSNSDGKRRKSAALNERKEFERNEERPRTSSKPSQKHDILQLFDVYKHQLSKSYRIGYKIPKTGEKNHDSCDLLTEGGFELGNNLEESTTDGNLSRVLFTKGAAVVKFKKGATSACHFSRKFGRTTSNLSSSFPPGAPSPKPAKDDMDTVNEKMSENLSKPRRPIRSKSEILYSRLKNQRERERESTFHSNRLPRISLPDMAMTVLEENEND